MQHSLLSTLLLVFLLLSVVYTLPDSKDFYKLLGVTKQSNQREIKKAYHKQSMKHHPDRSDDPDAALIFADISRAYEVLSDPEKKKIYDQHGHEGLEQSENGGGQAHPFGSFFQQFGFGGQQQGNQEQQKPKGAQAKIALPLTLEELYKGVTKHLTARKTIMCPHCGGSRADTPSDHKECRACKGTGQVTETRQLGPGMVQRIQRPCGQCNGQGVTITKKCRRCHGQGSILGDRDVVVMVLPGASNGDELRFEREADEGADIVAGDLLFHITTMPHALFKRSGDDLSTTLTLTLADALGGFKRDIPHLSGDTVRVSRSTVSQPGDVLVLKNRGMPKKGKPGVYGDLRVKLKVVLPKTLTDVETQHILTILNK
eukprot:gnl/Dysnectes_brevis/626_a693_3655.p1 GENE.gnl/Dysnectes_brevis/626_a693_3655~~gnl/Dysnectes_brevis/626_a693_3655.p1  ORF type:complete len:372 (-),score=118.05 gnl/Dysnectes_brevis/626_a693_3655:53-1168(-)